MSTIVFEYSVFMVKWYRKYLSSVDFYAASQDRYFDILSTLKQKIKNTSTEFLNKSSWSYLVHYCRIPENQIFQTVPAVFPHVLSPACLHNKLKSLRWVLFKVSSEWCSMTSHLPGPSPQVFLWDHNQTIKLYTLVKFPSLSEQWLWFQLEKSYLNIYDFLDFHHKILQCKTSLLSLLERSVLLLCVQWQRTFYAWLKWTTWFIHHADLWSFWSMTWTHNDCSGSILHGI